jgi:hypothetical protein
MLLCYVGVGVGVGVIIIGFVPFPPPYFCTKLFLKHVILLGKTPTLGKWLFYLDRSLIICVCVCLCVCACVFVCVSVCVCVSQIREPK